jgi:hypothetical protein
VDLLPLAAVDGWVHQQLAVDQMLGLWKWAGASGIQTRCARTTVGTSVEKVLFVFCLQMKKVVTKT